MKVVETDSALSVNTFDPSNDRSRYLLASFIYNQKVFVVVFVVVFSLF